MVPSTGWGIDPSLGAQGRCRISSLSCFFTQRSYSLNSLKGWLFRGSYRGLLAGLLGGILGLQGCIGDHIVDYPRAYQGGKTRRLDYSSYGKDTPP